MNGGPRRPLNGGSYRKPITHDTAALRGLTVVMRGVPTAVGRAFDRVDAPFSVAVGAVARDDVAGRGEEDAVSRDAVPVHQVAFEQTLGRSHADWVFVRRIPFAGFGDHVVDDDAAVRSTTDRVMGDRRFPHGSAVDLDYFDTARFRIHSFAYRIT